MIHLDTSIAVALLHGDATIAARLHPGEEPLRMSAIALAELEVGVRVSRRPAENALRFAALVRNCPIVPFDDHCARQFGIVRERLRKLGTPVGDLDTLIAATAIQHEAALATRNVRHFLPIEGLKILAW